MEHYTKVHLDLDEKFVNRVPLLLTKSRDIGFIHCKAIVTKSDK